MPPCQKCIEDSERSKRAGGFGYSFMGNNLECPRHRSSKPSNPLLGPYLTDYLTGNNCEMCLEENELLKKNNGSCFSKIGHKDYCTFHQNGKKQFSDRFLQAINSGTRSYNPIYSKPSQQDIHRPPPERNLLSEIMLSTYFDSDLTGEKRDRFYCKKCLAENDELRRRTGTCRSYIPSVPCPRHDLSSQKNRQKAQQRQVRPASSNPTSRDQPQGTRDQSLASRSPRYHYRG